MKKKRIRLLAWILLCAMCLSGCGTQLFEMTDEEEELIVRYAAYALAKHNIYQKDGLVSVNIDFEDDPIEEEKVAEDTQTPDEEETENPVPNGSFTALEVPESSISLADAIGYGSELQLTYNGFDIMDNYQEGRVYSLDARSGYTFVVAKFLMTNTSDSAVDVNVLNKNVSFRMAYEGSSWIKQDVTLLLTDLSTYTGSLAIGETKNLVILFEVPIGDVEAVGELAFIADKDGQSYAIVY